jgi:Na+/melibiose symporter-like transporter
MASDVVDYEESRSGRRLDGLVFSTYLFSLKIGLAIGGAVVGWILAYVNYSASSSVQPVEVLTTIKILFCVVPVVLYAACSSCCRSTSSPMPGGGHQPAVTSTSRAEQEGMSLPPAATSH